jgi:uncharacterized protein with PhoU and TrkA domain
MLNMNLMIAARDAEDAEALLGVSTVSSSANKISEKPSRGLRNHY